MLLLLPPEILSEIFETGSYHLAISDAWPPNPNQQWTSKSYRQFCLAISWTNSRLRSIIIRTRRCWQHIALSISEEHVTNPSLVDLFCVRSGSLPFDLYINLEPWTRWEGTNDAFLLLKTIIQRHASRCRALVLQSEERFEDFLSELLGNVDLPLLQLLDLSQSEDYETEVPLEQVVTLQLSTAHLTDLSITIAEMRPSPLSLSLPSPSFLRRLNIAAWVQQITFPNFLLDCPGLEHLRWDDTYTLNDVLPDEFVVTLPCLQSLQLETLAIAQLSILVAPRLEQIILDADGVADYETCDPRFITYPGSSLFAVKRLRMTSRCLTEHLAEHLMTSCPQLEELCIREYQPTSLTALQTLLHGIVRHFRESAGAQSEPQSSAGTFLLQMYASMGVGLTKELATAIYEALLIVPGLRVNIFSTRDVSVPNMDLPEVLAPFREESRFVYNCSAMPGGMSWPNYW